MRTCQLLPASWKRTLSSLVILLPSSSAHHTVPRMLAIRRCVGCNYFIVISGCSTSTSLAWLLDLFHSQLQKNERRTDGRGSPWLCWVFVKAPPLFWIAKNYKSIQVHTPTIHYSSSGWPQNYKSIQVHTPTGPSRSPK